MDENRCNLCKKALLEFSLIQLPKIVTGNRQVSRLKLALNAKQLMSLFCLCKDITKYINICD